MDCARRPKIQQSKRRTLKEFQGKRKGAELGRSGGGGGSKEKSWRIPKKNISDPIYTKSWKIDERV